MPVLRPTCPRPSSAASSASPLPGLPRTNPSNIRYHRATASRYRAHMGVLLSVNVARAHAAEYSGGPTGINKRPVYGPVTMAAPGPRGLTATAGSGLAGDTVYYREHGGDHQAVYAYAREDLDAWAAELERELPGGAFGENLTTSGLDVR